MQKTGRNDPCPCGSGKKYKKCCEMQAKPKKFTASVLPSAVKEQASGMHKVSSLFFRRATVAAVKSPESVEAAPSAAQDS
jgi:hypothetical protein